MKIPLKKKTQKMVLLILCVGTIIVFGLGVFILSLQNTKVPKELRADALFYDTKLPVEDRVQDLLSYMTLEEKIGQMALVDKGSIEELQDVKTYGLGALLSGAGAKPEDNTSDGWKQMVGDFFKLSKESRLSIPLLYGIDAIHGHSNVPEATIFPHFIGLGATGDAVLVEEVAKATAEELVATGIQWSFSPTLDLPRDIRWGRTYEAFSDDPLLVSRLGEAYIRGLQSSATKTEMVLSTPKHFVGLGSMVWGSSSNKNFKIDQGRTEPDMTALRSEYLPPFASAVDAGVKSVMVGLNSWGDTKLSANAYLLTDVLKGELGFKGFAVSDWYAVYEIPGGDYRAAVTAINAGIDMVMLPFDYKPFIKNVEKAVRRGEIREERIDDAVGRILRAKFELGLFDEQKEQAVPTDVLGSDAHRILAQEAVASSLVLLKDENVLPLTSKVKTINVAGSAADNAGMQMGAWTVEWQGIDGNWLPKSTSILSGIEKMAPKGTRVEYNLTADFEPREEKADIGIAVVGEKPYAEGWGDRAHPTLTQEDKDTIQKLREVSKKVVVIIIAGRPLFITEEISTWDAVVMGWLPGSEGQGVADVLFGKKTFVGKLPLPWPAHVGQLPIAQNGDTNDGTEVLFPRYFGLR